MRYRTLGKSGVKVSEVALGCWTLGGPDWIKGGTQHNGWPEVAEDEATAAVKLAVDSGVTHFDTADAYGSGRSERALARIFARLGLRSSDLVIASKVGWVPGSAAHAYEPLHLRHQLEQTLANLRREHVDVYYFHHGSFGDRDEHLHAAAETMDRFVREGKVRVKGQSALSADEFEKAVPVVRPDVLQSWAHALNDEFVRPGTPVAALLEAQDLSFVAAMPFAHGRLLDVYDPRRMPRFEPGDHRRGHPKFTPQAIAELRPKLDRYKARFGPTTDDLAAMAINFCLAHPRVATVLPGFERADHARSAVGAVARPPLSADDVAYVRQTIDLSPARRPPPGGLRRLTAAASRRAKALLGRR
jgi:myo-inositol catabolism protein IolS